MKTPADKPFSALQQFAKLLGWSSLRIYRKTVDDDSTKSQSSLVTWYECGDRGNPRTDCFLQFNESPIGQTETYRGAVYAIRYRLCTGWHAFTLQNNQHAMQAEAVRVSEWLHRDWFDAVSKRREFRRLHPEYVGYTWQKVREVGLPNVE